jgi:hypothetical protein
VQLRIQGKAAHDIESNGIPTNANIRI